MNAYAREWRALNEKWRRMESESGDLRAVFADLHRQQIETGFIRGSAEGIERVTYCHPERDSRCLRIQYNPERATRFRGAGLQAPPHAHASVHDGCFLCRENIEWQQEERQLGYEVEANGRRYVAWMNPFPLLPVHIVMATREHLGQEWSLYPGGQLSPRRIIADLVQLVSSAPGYAGIYNGVDAGASIPDHMHYQFFLPPQDHYMFPLEVEAARVRGEQTDTSHWHLEQYPMDVVHWHGATDEVIERAAEWLPRWADHQEDLPDMSANVLAISEESGHAVSLYFVPRHRRLTRASWLSGIVGGLEVLGELVLSSPEEKWMIDSGALNYFKLEKLLAAVCTPLNMPR